MISQLPASGMTHEEYIKFLEDEVIVLRYVLLMHHGGMELVSPQLEVEYRSDLIPRIKAAIATDTRLLFPH